MSNISLTVACGPYDRMEALAKGILQPEGIDVTYLGILSPPEIFSRMIKTNAFDICEMSLSMYFTLRSKGEFPFIALPVFSRPRFSPRLYLREPECWDLYMLSATQYLVDQHFVAEPRPKLEDMFTPIVAWAE